MSQILLDDFLRAIRQANSGFNERNSSLRGLFRELRRQLTAGDCKIMNYEAAQALCGNARDARLGKYEGAIRALLSQWGVPDSRGGRIYLPILATENLVVVRTRSAPQKMNDILSGDSYITDVVGILTHRGATLVDCTRSLHWLVVSARGVSKLPKALGTLQSNLLSRQAGRTPVAPSFDYRTHVASDTCTVHQRLAQPKLPSAREQATRAAVAPALTGLSVTDTLYLVGHCNEGGAALTYKLASLDTCRTPHCPTRHIDLWRIDAVTLAALLVEEGLSRDHQRIEVIGCFTGGVEVDAVQSVQPFAQRLAGALSGWGYSKVKVAGAMGLTSGSRGHLRRVEAQGRMTRERNKHYIENDKDDYRDRRSWYPAVLP